MTPLFVSQMRDRREQIHDRWRTLLRIEPATSPLANPELLAHLVPETVDGLLSRLDRKAPGHGTTRTAEVPTCDCGLNPYPLFFKAGERALLEVAIEIQFDQAPGVRANHDLIELAAMARAAAREETNLFCDICVHRLGDRCHLAPAGATRAAI